MLIPAIAYSSNPGLTKAIACRNSFRANALIVESTARAERAGFAGRHEFVNADPGVHTTSHG